MGTKRCTSVSRIDAHKLGLGQFLVARRGLDIRIFHIMILSIRPPISTGSD
jgi:hypothetical protein